MKFFRIIFTFVLILSQGFIFIVCAQSRDTIWIPVTYYDFHSDGSNPNFNQGFGHHLPKGMVKNNLSPESKPMLNKVFPEVMNDRIDEWFRPSGVGNEAEFNVDDNRWTGLVPYNNKNDEWVSQKYDPAYDMASVVIYDSLPLVRNQGNVNTYSYENSSFFPIDNRGFGNEEINHPQHNYSFTMEIHAVFRYLPQENQFFEFLGDDDVWVFINGKLALDIGGTHHPAYDQIRFDRNTAEQFGLDSGKVYPLDFFFAERQVTNSHIRFQTNMKIIKRKLAIGVTPGKTIKAGETAKCAAYIISDTGIVSLTELSGKVEWDFTDFAANNPKSILKSKYDTAWVTPTRAHTTLRVTAHFTDSETDLNTSANIVVVPNSPDHIVIEASYDKPGDKFLWEDNPMDTAIIEATGASVENFYGILRDKYGNWIGPADPLTWSSGDNTVLKVENGPNPELGQGKATRRELVSDTAIVGVAEYDYSGKILRDDITIKIFYLASIFTEVEYYDTDSRPDGLIDVIRIKTDGNIKISEHFFEDFYKLIGLPEYRKFSYDRNSFHIIENGFEIRVQQPEDIEPFTGTNDRDILKFKKIDYPGKGSFPEQTIGISDKMGPVINKAFFAGASLDAFSKNNIPDTLEVYFSEKVFIPKSDIPFQFCNKHDNTTQYTMKLDLDLISGGDKSNVMKFLVLAKTKEYPEHGDSIWIQSGRKVVDVVNIPQDSATISRLLTVRYPLHININALGPYGLGDPVPSKLADEPGKKGAVILMELKGLFSENENWKTRCDIFDPVGNTIKKDIKEYYKEVKVANGKIKKFFVFVWDLRNKYGRKVYPGTYCGFVSISRDGFLLKSKKVYIGITNKSE